MYEAEESLISCLLSDSESIEKVYTLEPQMFQSEVYGKVFYECKKAFDEHTELTLAEMKQKLQANGIKDYEIDDALERALNTSAMGFQAEGYGKAILNHYKKTCVDRILERSLLKDAEIENQIDGLIDDLEKLRGGDVSSGKTVADLTKEYEDRYFCEKNNSLILLGEDGIDNLTGGFQGGDLVLLGARPSVGKSALATQWAWQFAKQGLRVGYYNCEMQEAACFERFIAAKTGISVTRVRLAKAFNNDEEERYRRAVRELSQQENIILFTGAKKINEIRNDQRKYKFSIIIIDYLQLLFVDDRYSGNRAAEVQELSLGLKRIAMDYKIPIIALTQLNRASESRANKEPQLFDLRESGSLEQDASTVFFLWNKSEEDTTQKGFKTAKSRAGTLDRYDLIFDGASMSFRSEHGNTPFDREVIHGEETDKD